MLVSIKNKLFVTVAAFEIDNLTEDELNWLMHFRKAKRIETLEFLVERADDKNRGNVAVLNAINVGYCSREKELLSK